MLTWKFLCVFGMLWNCEIGLFFDFGGMLGGCRKVVVVFGCFVVCLRFGIGYVVLFGWEELGVFSRLGCGFLKVVV